MGTWSHEPFGNDTANDWAYELEGTSDLRVVEAALQAVLDEEGYLEASLADEAIAAIEVIAKLLGRGTQSDSYTRKVDAWVATITVQPSAELIDKARFVLGCVVAEDSELRELWDEGDPADAAAWRASIEQLRAALGAA